MSAPQAQPKKSVTLAKGFNFQGSWVFLTYPQTDLDPQEALALFQARFQVQSYTISKERHKDGSFHVHAMLGFVSKLHTTNERYFDLLLPGGTRHPNVAKASSLSDRKRIDAYIKKDGLFISNFVVPKTQRQALFDDLLTQGLTPQFVRSHPEIMSLNLNNLRAWQAFVTPPPLKFRDIPKHRHIWLSGPANSGKSTWLRAFLSLCDAPAEIPLNEDFAHVDKRNDCLFADEFRGSLTVQLLNRLCDGQTRLNTKGGATQIDYPLVVICSNFTIEEAYSKVSDQILATLHARFHCYVAPIYPKFPVSKI